MNEEEARRIPFFSGVWPMATSDSAARGPVCRAAVRAGAANYGLDSLRFIKPSKPASASRYAITCKGESLRPGKGYGEVRWDTKSPIRAPRCGAYDVLTMVSEQAIPQAPAN